MIPLYDLNPHHRFPWVTVLLIAANVIVLAGQGLEPSERTVYQYGFIPRRATELDNGKPIVVQPVMMNAAGNLVFGRPMRLATNPAAVYLTFFTAMFLHANWLHLVMNMWMLWIFGNNVEDRLGRFMYLCFYLLGGLAATLCQWMSDPMSTAPMIGASGAVAAVLGAYAVTFPKAKVQTLIFVGLILLVELPALVVLGVWFLLQMTAGLNIFREFLGGDNVAFWAHVGGFVAGVVLMPILSLGSSPPGTDWKREVEELFQFEDPRFRKK
jgi:rhomboid family protein